VTDELKEYWEQQMSKGIDVPKRYVSPTQYDVLKEMLGENKLDEMCYPKPEFYEEYVERVRAKQR